MTAVPPANPHTLLEDAQALFIGTLLVASGVVMFKTAGLLTGGTAGLTFLLHYLTQRPFGLLFVLANLPFFWLALRRMGGAFTLKTFVAIGLLAVMTEGAPQVLHFDVLHPLVAAILGGFTMGVGFLILFRHRASLGGFNVLALYLQDKLGWPAGKVLLAIDATVLLGAFFAVPPERVAASLIGVLALNLTITMNHKRGRYISF